MIQATVDSDKIVYDYSNYLPPIEWQIVKQLIDRHYVYDCYYRCSKHSGQRFMNRFNRRAEACHYIEHYFIKAPVEEVQIKNNRKLSKLEAHLMIEQTKALESAAGSLASIMLIIIGAAVYFFCK